MQEETENSTTLILVIFFLLSLHCLGVLVFPVLEDRIEKGKPRNTKLLPAIREPAEHGPVNQVLEKCNQRNHRREF